MKIKSILLTLALTLGLSTTVFAAPVTGRVLMPDGSQAKNVKYSVWKQNPSGLDTQVAEKSTDATGLYYTDLPDATYYLIFRTEINGIAYGKDTPRFKAGVAMQPIKLDKNYELYLELADNLGNPIFRGIKDNRISIDRHFLEIGISDPESYHLVKVADTTALNRWKEVDIVTVSVNSEGYKPFESSYSLRQAKSSNQYMKTNMAPIAPVLTLDGKVNLTTNKDNKNLRVNLHRTGPNFVDDNILLPIDKLGNIKVELLETAIYRAELVEIDSNREIIRVLSKPQTMELESSASIIIDEMEGTLPPTVGIKPPVVAESNPVAPTIKPVTTSTAPKVIVDGKTLPISAVNEKGRVLVPLRAIFEALDAKVDYDSVTKVITGTQNDTTVILTLNKKEASVNGTSILLDVPAQIYSASTLVPSRFIAETLGANVKWENNTVIITSK